MKPNQVPAPNLFCFRRLGAGAARPDDAPIWLFDHEFPDKNCHIARSFDEWLVSFLALGRGSAP